MKQTAIMLIILLGLAGSCTVVLSEPSLNSQPIDDYSENLLLYFPSSVSKITFMCPDFSTLPADTPGQKSLYSNPHQPNATFPDGRPLQLFVTLHIECLALGEHFTVLAPDHETSPVGESGAPIRGRGLSHIVKDIYISFNNADGESHMITGKAKLSLCTAYKAANVNGAISKSIEMGTLKHLREYKGYEVLCFPNVDKPSLYYAQVSDYILLEAVELPGLETMLDVASGEKSSFIEGRHHDELTEILEKLDVSTAYGKQWKYFSPDEELLLKLALLEKLDAPLEVKQIVEDQYSEDRPTLITSVSSIISEGSIQESQKEFFVFRDRTKAKDFYTRMKKTIDHENRSGEEVLMANGNTSETSRNRTVSNSSIKIDGSIVTVERVVERGNIPSTIK